MLTQANYHTWLSAVKDELYAIEADALLAKSALSDTGAEQRGNVADDDVDPSIRRKAFIMLKRSISQDIKSKLEDIDSGEVETLLRRVRLTFYRPSPHTWLNCYMTKSLPWSLTTTQTWAPTR